MLDLGARIPLVGLGTWPLRGRLCRDIVERALRLGYQHIDTAELYENEHEVGEGLRASGVERGNIFVTTKVMPAHFAPRDLQRAAKESLMRLRLSEVDLLLLHWPNPWIPLSETLGALCEVKRAGLTRYIGVSNFVVSDIQEAVRQSSEPLLCNQVEMNATLVRPKLIEACWGRGIAIVAYTPLARGEAKNDAVLSRIGRVHGKSAAQISLRWLVQQDIAVIPRTSQIDRLHENHAIFDFHLSEAEMVEISSVARRRSRLAKVTTPLRAVARSLPEPAKTVLRAYYRMLRRIVS